MATNLQNFLIDSKAKFQKATTEKVFVVLGNESADLDSIVSSVVFAFYLSKQNKQQNDSTIFVPIINIPKEDLSLRTETRWILRHLWKLPQSSIVEDYFCFHEELEQYLNRTKQQRNLSVTLTDHNRLAASQENELGKYVIQIVDHHVDEGFYKSTCTSREIQMVGSCSSLVAEKVLKHKELLASDSVGLLLSAIVIDTGNLNPAFKKAVELDISVGKELVSIAEFKPPTTDAQTLCNTLQELRSNVSELSSRDLLKKDYKQWAFNGVDVGFSSVPMLFDQWLKRDGLQVVVDALTKYCADKKLDYLIILTAFVENNVMHRQVGFFVPKQVSETSKQLKQHLEQSDLKLNELKTIGTIDLSSVQNVWFYEQKNNTASRKQAQPIVNAFFDAHK